MNYYRDVYLKSDEWKTLRAAKIHTVGGYCDLCHEKSLSNDVHHLKYKNLKDVLLHDLKVLCRDCHDKVHTLMKKYPKMKTLGRTALWRTIRFHLGNENVKNCIRKLCEKKAARDERRQQKLEAWRKAHRSHSYHHVTANQPSADTEAQ